MSHIFPALPTVNGAAMNTEVHISFKKKITVGLQHCISGTQQSDSVIYTHMCIYTNIFFFKILIFYRLL